MSSKLATFRLERRIAMTSLEFMERYYDLNQEEIELEQVKKNAFDVFHNCDVTDLENSLEVNWSPLFNWSNAYPFNSNSFFVQDIDFVKSCFQKVIEGKMTRDEFEIALSPTIRSVEKYYTQLEHEKEEIEKLIINKLKTHVKSIDNVLLRNLLLFLLPSIKNLIIRFLIFDKSC